MTCRVRSTTCGATIGRCRQRFGVRSTPQGVEVNAEIVVAADHGHALVLPDLDELIELSADVQDLLKKSSAKLNLSPRSYHRLIKVARTIADLDNKENIETAHVLEALQYRVKL